MTSGLVNKPLFRNIHKLGTTLSSLTYKVSECHSAFSSFQYPYVDYLTVGDFFPPNVLQFFNLIKNQHLTCSVVISFDLFGLPN